MESSEHKPTWGTLDVVLALVAIMGGVVLTRTLGIGLSSSAGLYNAVVMTLLYLFFLAVVLIFSVVKYGRSLSDLGLKSFRPGRVLWMAIVWWLAVRLGILLYSVAVAAAAGWFGVRPPSEVVSTVPRIFGPGPTGFALAVLVAVIIGPVVEEILFRGFMYAAFKRALGVWPAIVISAAIFGVFHANPWLMAPIGVMGGVMAYLYEKEGTLAMPVALHALNNLAAVVIVYTLVGQ